MAPSAKPARREREITLRFVAEPMDLNMYGNVHGGSVMKWIDQAGYACAAGWSGRPCVTVYVGGIRFVRPIPVGRLVEVHARLVHVGRTSMHVAIDVSSRDLQTRLCEATTHCVIVFVALDAPEGAPVPVPAWQPRSEEDRKLAEYAQQVMALGRDVEQAVARYRLAAADARKQ